MTWPRGTLKGVLRESPLLVARQLSALLLPLRWSTMVVVGMVVISVEGVDEVSWLLAFLPAPSRLLLPLNPDRGS